MDHLELQEDYEDDTDDDIDNSQSKIEEMKAPLKALTKSANDASILDTQTYYSMQQRVMLYHTSEIIPEIEEHHEETTESHRSE